MTTVCAVNGNDRGVCRVHSQPGTVDQPKKNERRRKLVFLTFNFEENEEGVA